MAVFHRKAEELAQHFARLPEVAAVALGGSQSSGAADEQSDIDFYVYTTADISTADQLKIIDESGEAARSDLNLPYWGGVNMWVDAKTGIVIDCVYFDVKWMEGQISRVMELHQPSLGYSTCFCRTVNHSQVLYDPQSWFAGLQSRCSQDYPEPLQRNIIQHNHPVLRAMLSSYMHQIENAVHRRDAVSVNHRVAALLASYFDILFALNCILHPGEKRLLALARKECPLLPDSMEEDIEAVLKAAASNADVIVHLNRLLDRLDALLVSSGFVPPVS